MNIYKVTVDLEGGGVEERRIKLPSHASEVTLKQWSKIQLIERPEILDLSEMNVSDSLQSIAYTNWMDLVTYSVQTLKALGNEEEAIWHIDLSELSADRMKDTDGFLAMYAQCMQSILGYQRKFRRYFNHGKYQYSFPEVVQHSFDRKLTGGKMTLGMAADAFQIDHILSAKNEDGSWLMEDQPYHRDIGVVASLTRKVLPGGKLEKIPMNTTERAEWLKERTEELLDLPMDVALDGCFFLTSSKQKLTTTLWSALRLRNSLQAQLSSEVSRRIPISGTPGTGIA